MSDQTVRRSLARWAALALGDPWRVDWADGQGTTSRENTATSALIGASANEQLGPRRERAVLSWVLTCWPAPGTGDEAAHDALRRADLTSERLIAAVQDRANGGRRQRRIPLWDYTDVPIDQPLDTNAPIVGHAHVDSYSTTTLADRDEPELTTVILEARLLVAWSSLALEQDVTPREPVFSPVLSPAPEE